MAFPPSVPEKLIKAFSLWLGPVPGVNVAPAGSVRVNVVAAERAIDVTPPSMPSTEFMFLLMAVVPHAPGRSPVFGTFKNLLTVLGILCPRR
jgi:hypothetical protein